MFLARLVAMLLAAGIFTNAADNGYYRFPAIKGNRIVFTAEGDLWVVSADGGRASRLTTDEKEETRPAISQDGQWLAFCANYEGPQEVYVMPFEGGLPKRLTFDSGRNSVLGWTPAGEILYATQNPKGPSSQMILACVRPDTLAKTYLPLADASEASFDESGIIVYFTRMGLTGDNARHYRGGAASDLWSFRLDQRQEAARIPLPSPAERPMWWKGRLYFVSDHLGIDNIWSCKSDGSDMKQHTRHTDFEVRNAALGDGRIVYQHGADIRVFDIDKGESRLVKIQLVSDFEQSMSRYVPHPMDFQGDYNLSQSGEKVVLTGRGQIAVAGPGQGRRVDILVPESSRSRLAVLSADNKAVYAICDAGGEQEIWRFPADGTQGGKVLTSGGDTLRIALTQSPDGRWLAHADKHRRLFLLNLTTGENKQIDSSRAGYGEFAWSPDSKTLAFVRPDTDRFSPQIVLYDLETGMAIAVMGDKYPCSSPCFTPDGKWLFFLSNRHYQATPSSPWGDRNMGPLFDRRTKAYGLALQSGLRWHYKARNELDSPEPAKGDKNEKAANVPPIQWAGLAERLYEVPLEPGNFRSLNTDGKRLYFLSRESDGKTNLKTLDISPTASQPVVFAADVINYQLSQDTKKILLVKAQNALHVVDGGSKAPNDLTEATVRTGDWSLTLDPRLEWKQIFGDAWRMHRDYLFDEKMRGVNWKKIRKKYEPLLDRVNDRNELNDLLAQMNSELGALHSQVRGGDVRISPESGAPAFLGAVLERIKDGYRIEHVYRADLELPSEASPLSEAGVQDGDVITHVNGKSVLSARDISDLLNNQAGQQALLSFKRGKEEPKSAVVIPINAVRQNNLRYGDWEETCRIKVLEAGHGDIGYLHLRAMGGSDIASFARDFYAHVNRKGLIIDVRRNNGGNIDSWIIEKLLRRAWEFWTYPDMSFQGTNMQQTFRGHLAVLIDERTYSDGETFSMGIKTLGLAPLVGRRTAGAGAWLGDGNVQVDGGLARAAENAQFLTENGSWVIEGVGVPPDIDVLNQPFETFNGKDRQLEAAIKLLQEKIAKEPVKPLKGPGIPAIKK